MTCPKHTVDPSIAGGQKVAGSNPAGPTRDPSASAVWNQGAIRPARGRVIRSRCDGPSCLDRGCIRLVATNRRRATGSDPPERHLVPADRPDPGLRVADRGRGHDRLGLVLFGVVAATDWIDGAIARATGQVTEVGKMLDPVADRLAIAAGLIALVVRGAFPLWAALLILVRDASIWSSGLLLLTRSVRGSRSDTSARSATFAVMAAIGLIAWGTLGYAFAPAALAFGWGLYVVGIVDSASPRSCTWGTSAGRWPRRGTRSPEIEARTGNLLGSQPARPAKERDRMEFPEDLRYTKEHEWVRDEGHGRVRVGITDYAQDALGDVVYVTSRSPGPKVTANQPFGEVESTKSVSDVYAPVTGTVIERNALLDERPELVNEQPYGDGWLVVVEAADPSELEGLMDAAAYRAFVEQQTD